MIVLGEVCTTCKHISFVLTETKPKTDVYRVISNSGGEYLATIKWHGPWRQYVVQPESDTIWNRDCLRDVIEFIQGLMDARRAA